MQEQRSFRIGLLSAGTIVMLGLIFVQHDEFVNGFWPRGVAVAWNMFSHLLFVTALLALLVPLLNMNFPLLRSFLGGYLWQPLARLSFTVYLVHFVVTMWYFGTTRSAIHVSFTSATVSFFSCLILSFLTAIPFCMLFELPFMNIEKWLLFPPRNKKERDAPLQDQEKS